MMLIVVIWLLNVVIRLLFYLYSDFLLKLLLQFLLVLFCFLFVKFVLIDALLKPFKVPGFILLQE